MDGQEFMANLYYVFILSVVMSSELIIFGLIYYIVTFIIIILFLHTRYLLIPYAYVSIESINCTVL